MGAIISACLMEDTVLACWMLGIAISLSTFVMKSIVSPQTIDSVKIGDTFVPIIKNIRLVQYFPNQPLINSWANNVDSSIIVKKITIVKLTFFRPGSQVANFIHMEVDAHDQYGNKIPGVVFLRGNCVAILIQYIKDSVKYIVLVSQPRLAVGKDILEAPAGMLDDEKNLKGKMIDEVEEETGIKILSKDLIPLGESYTSPGLLDEEIHMFMYNLPMDFDTSTLHGRICGNQEEGERTSVIIMPEKEAIAKVNDSKLLAMITRANSLTH